MKSIPFRLIFSSDCFLFIYFVRSRLLLVRFSFPLPLGYLLFGLIGRMIFEWCVIMVVVVVFFFFNICLVYLFLSWFRCFDVTYFFRSLALSPLFMLVISIMATSKIWANHKKSDVTIASSVFKSKTIESSFWCLFWWHWLFMCDTSWLSSSNSSALVSQKKPTQFDDLISAGVQNGMKTHTQLTKKNA